MGWLGAHHILLPFAALLLLCIATNNDRSRAGQDVEKLGKRVIVIVGTAGSGTRNVHSLLAAAGVWMHPDTNAEYDSNIFIRKVKETPAFSMPGSNQGLIWETRKSPADYKQESLSNGVYQDLLHQHKQAAADMLASVPDDVDVWAWKEPQAIFTLPFLVKVFPNIHVIHEVRDGRDVALSNINSSSLRTTRKFQRHYIQTIAGKDYTDAQLYSPEYSKAAASVWAQVNLNAKKWATENGLGVQGRYSISRLEDFCNPATMHNAIQSLLRNAGIAYNEAAVQRAAATINLRKCETNRWMAAMHSGDTNLAAAVQAIDRSIGSALEAFQYKTQMPFFMPDWLAATDVMGKLRSVALHAASSGSPVTQPGNIGRDLRPIILTEVSNGYEAVLGNWLNWLEASDVDLSQVLVVTKGSSAAAVRKMLEGRGPSVFEMPALNTPPIRIRNKNDDEALNRLWVERVRILYELVSAGIPVLMSDLDAVWFKNALSDIQSHAGYDMVLSQGRWPPDTHKIYQTAGCLGLAFFNATDNSRAVLRHMLQHMQHNMHIMFDDQQALNHQLLMANLAVNSSTLNIFGLQDQAVAGQQIITSPNPMRALFLPHRQYQRYCDSATHHEAVVAHCRIKDVQNFKTPHMKQHVMRSMRLWKDGSFNSSAHGSAPPTGVSGFSKTSNIIEGNTSVWLPTTWVGQPPPLDPLACTPQLLLVAAPKAGTTAVFDYLNGTIAGFTVHSSEVHFLNGTQASTQYINRFRKLPAERRRFHPRLVGSFLKEMHIFDKDTTLLPQALKQFPGIDNKIDDPLTGKCSFPHNLGLIESSPPALVRFEATPGYMHTPVAVQQLEQFVPNARYLILLREPVSRVISHLNMKIQGQGILNSVAPENYSKAWTAYMSSELIRQMSEISQCVAQISRHSPVPDHGQLVHCLFGMPMTRDINDFDLYKGLYDVHLSRWFAEFASNQTLIWSSKAFSETPKQHLKQLITWLGLDAAEINRDIDFVKIHERSYPTNRPFPAALFQQLVAFHEPHKLRTIELLTQQGYDKLAQQMQHAWNEELLSTRGKLVAMPHT